jgi:hypothetical protein
MSQQSLDAFRVRLEQEYIHLFHGDPEYQYASQRTTPQALAAKMTDGLRAGSANKDGEGIKRACKHFKIPHTYKAIRAFLQS